MFTLIRGCLIVRSFTTMSIKQEVMNTKRKNCNMCGKLLRYTHFKEYSDGTYHATCRNCEAELENPEEFKKQQEQWKKPK